MRHAKRVSRPYFGIRQMAVDKGFGKMQAFNGNEKQYNFHHLKNNASGSLYR